MAVAGAAFGASKALEDILAEQMLKAKMAQQQQEQAARLKLDEQRLNESIRQNDLDEKFRGRQEDRVAAGDREKNNAIGVRRMIGEGITRRVPIADMEGMAFAEGIELPQPAKVERDPIADYRQRKEIDQEFTQPSAPQKRGTHVVGGNLVDDSGKVLFTDPDKSKPDGATNPSAYSVERARRTIQSIDELLPKVSGRTTGMGGAIMRRVPGTDAMDFSAELKTLASNIAFNELTQMREASKTGGALGQVSDREGQLLQSALGALEQDQSPGNVKAQLVKIRESITRWQDAAGVTGNGLEPMTPMSSHGSTPAAGGSLYEQYLARKKGGG